MAPTYEQVFTYVGDFAICKFCGTKYELPNEFAPPVQKGDGCDMCDPQEADYDD